ncbi:hypothetical protein VB151_13000 [Xanthomonas fragariae]|uniref:Type III effector protein XopAD n=3 Tax=Xanthomonas fragariae TaxID=48664 RepID=A0A1Y6HE51_9XANT|nr:hypothetical protein [Xanthomonas fragariae]MBL9197483.1 hypothetical protein [Xanthomonas fragariae]MBL9222620.1 hypothetical protein [Xanthomonas fragariae]MDM7573031.1 hypothetical protein [Xanthomonas fragariae]MDM7582297.1 hypothetical protein [Xanthomonas fragariae]MEA5174583.1 hypothetical protein [Xanthomonas fragariae]
MLNAKRGGEWEGCAAIADEICKQSSQMWFHVSWIGLSIMANSLSQYPEFRLPKPGYVYRQALSRIGQCLADGHRDTHVNPLSMANLANALSKCVDIPNPQGDADLATQIAQCTAGLERIANEINLIAGQVRGNHNEELHLQGFGANDLAQICNGLSKVLSKDSQTAAAVGEAMGVIAREIVLRRRSAEGLSKVHPKDLAILAAGMGRLVAESDSRRSEAERAGDAGQRLCRADASEYARAGLAELGQELEQRVQPRDGLSQFNPQDLAMLANGIGKVAGDADVPGLIGVGWEMVRRGGTAAGLSKFTIQGLAMVANGLSRPPTSGRNIAPGLVAVGRAVVQRAKDPQWAQHADVQQLAMLANGLSKVAHDRDSAAALAAVGKEIDARLKRSSSLSDFQCASLAVLANALAKLPGMQGCATGLKAVGRALERRIQLDGALPSFKHEELTMLAGALRIVAQDDPACETVLEALGEDVAQQAEELDGLSHYDAKQLAVLANGLSKLAEGGASQSALSALGKELAQRSAEHGDLADFADQGLAMLANALGKLTQPEDALPGLSALAREVKRRRDPLDGWPGVTLQGLTMLANDLGKWLEDQDCADGLIAVGEEFLQRAAREAGSLPLSLADMAVLARAFGKAVEGHDHAPIFLPLLTLLSRQVASRANELDGLSALNGQHLAMLANGLGKLAENGGHVPGLSAIGREVARRGDTPDGLSDVGSEHLAMLANGLGKLPDERDCREGLVALGQEVVGRAGRLSDISLLGLAILAQGLSKTNESGSGTDMQAALGLLGRELLQRATVPDGLSGLGTNQLTMLSNALSKASAERDSVDALLALDGEVARRAVQHDRLSDFNAQQLASVANGLSKAAEDVDRLPGLSAVGQEVVRRSGPGSGLSEFSSQGLAMLVNGLAKIVADPNARQAMATLGAEVERRIQSPGMAGEFNAQQLGMLANGLAKVAYVHDGLAGLSAISHEIVDRAQEPAGLSVFNQQTLGWLAGAFSRGEAMADCVAGMQVIAERLGVGNHTYATFSPSGLAQLANALSRMSRWAESQGYESVETLMRGRMHALAVHLLQMPERLADFPMVELSILLKALAKAEQYDTLAALAEPALKRLQELHGQGKAGSISMEANGSLCVGLLPLVRSKDPGLHRHRRKTLELLNRLQPDIAHEIELVLQQHAPQAQDISAADHLGNTRTARKPGHSLYLTLKTYAAVARKWRWSELGGTPAHINVRRAELGAWLRTLVQQAQPLLDAELGASSWAVRAMIESDEMSGALHQYLSRNAATVKAELARAGHTQARVRLDAVARQWNHPPDVPQAGAGVAALPPRVDSFGRLVADSASETASRRYSLLTRLTGNMPVIEVELDGVPTSFQLERTVTHQGVPYCFNIFGGSALKLGASGFEDIQDRQARKKNRNPKLMGVRACDVLPDAPFMTLLTKLFPNKESFWYFQRLMRPSPPAGIAGLGPADHVLEGRFRMLFMPDLPDRLDAPAHPFKLQDQQGRAIAIQPYDGCGFIKASVVQRMPAYRRALGQEGGQAMKPIGHGRPSNLSLSALQHYVPDEAVAQEAVEALRERLPALQQKQELSGETLFRCAANGLIQGKTGILVASADDRAHLPEAKSSQWDGKDLLIGKSPFDKANMVVFEPERIGTEAEEDATAQFLGSCAALQYSYVGVEDAVQVPGEDATPQRAESERAWFGLKGIDIVVPDALWPAEYKDCDRVGPAKDVKVHSDWQHSKAPVQRDTAVDGRGAYIGTEVFAPGSLVALPLSTIKRLDADCDGDTVQLFAGLPTLSQHVRQDEQERQANPQPSFKPPKTHTPAIDPDTGAYDPSRTAQIMAIYRKVVEDFTGLQVSLYAQTPEVQAWVAERAVLGTYEGTDATLRSEVLRQLDVDAPDPAVVERLVQAADEDVAHALHAPAKQVAELLRALLQQWRDGREEPLPLPGSMTELLPHLENAYAQASNTRARLHALVDRYPRRKLRSRLGYTPDDLLGSLRNLLSIGIKVGTDAYKSDTATREFSACASSLKSLLGHAPSLHSVPYTKGAGAKLAAGRLEAQETLKLLERIPTLSARVMLRCSEHIVHEDLWPSPQPMPPLTEEMRMQAGEHARQLALRAQQEEPGVSALMRRLVDQDQDQGRSRLVLLHKKLRSPQSLSDDILVRARRKQLSVDDAAGQLSGALRYTVEVDPSALAETVRTALDTLQKQGIRCIGVQNHFVSSSTYSGVVAQLRMREQVEFQVEFHTPQSLQLKLDLHADYKLSQAEQLADRPDNASLQTLIERMREARARVPLPPGIERIVAYAEHAPLRRQATVGPSRVVNQQPQGAAGKPSTRLATRLRNLALEREEQINAAIREVVPDIVGGPKLLISEQGKKRDSIRSKIERKVGQPETPQQ